MINQTVEKGAIFFNFLAKDKENAEAIVAAGDGLVVPGIAAADFSSVTDAVKVVKRLKEAAPIVSIGLGGDGNIENWRKVLDIAEAANPGHINQPFNTAAYARGYLDAKGHPHIVNALVRPSGTVGTILLPNGQEMAVDFFAALANDLGIQSVKLMPVKGLKHLEELVALSSALAAVGVQGIEPAGGIQPEHIKPMYEAVRKTGIQWMMPHIFGAAIDKETGRTIPDVVHGMINSVR
ncbi:KDGP aldolase [Camelliibacillus cellulosilyticus]|uniref:KDGP aldolase n=1 Tax=Camelliibacillus cellulosilyticus TaxID=2174486 RepID=A0ABV9GLA0_9BACL